MFRSYMLITYVVESLPTQTYAPCGPRCARLTDRLADSLHPQVGTISANGDDEIGKLIARAMERVGKEGVITVQVCDGLADGLGFWRKSGSGSG